MATSFCLSVCLFVRLFVRLSSVTRIAAGPLGPWVSRGMFPPRKIYASGGGLLVGSINAPHLFRLKFKCAKSLTDRKLYFIKTVHLTMFSIKKNWQICLDLI